MDWKEDVILLELFQTAVNHGRLKPGGIETNQDRDRLLDCWDGQDRNSKPKIMTKIGKVLNHAETNQR